MQNADTGFDLNGGGATLTPRQFNKMVNGPNKDLIRRQETNIIFEHDGYETRST